MDHGKNRDSWNEELRARQEIERDDGARLPLSGQSRMRVLIPERLNCWWSGQTTTEPVWPSASGYIANLLGLRKNISFFDVQAGCTGFNYALSVGEMSVKSGQYRTVAVVGTDKLSAITNYEDRNTCVLFGDGAGAVVLQESADCRNHPFSSRGECEGP